MRAMTAPLASADIARLVDRFYDRVQADPELGPVFNAAVDDWDEHKRTLVAFWSSIALGTRSYRGNPMAAHRPHPIREEHFAHWLALWREVAEAELPPEHAKQLIEHATRIGSSLRYGLGLQERRGVVRALPVIGQ
jgi:hemoglobin